MGEQKVTLLKDKEKRKHFMKSLLEDVQAMEYMLEHDWFESGITRIGAEQEMVIVDLENFKPYPIAVDILEELKNHDWLCSELAKFNLEINLSPLELTGDCFSLLEKENRERLAIIESTLSSHGAAIVLTGILPTLMKHDLEMHNLTPLTRYKALMKALESQLTNNEFEVRLDGIDELIMKHDSPLVEACNTSFQVHLQVDPNQFVQKYNLAQAITGPVMAIAANSPLVFGKRLWHESRIAMFQQSIDTRASRNHMRERSPRVQFGNDWIHESILDIYRDDIARYRVLLAGDVSEDAIEKIKDNKVPKLKSLQIHNSTVYRWNRPCYGISDNGKPHLRIENRVFAAGPTVQDETANAVFWLGIMQGMSNQVDDIRNLLSFADVRDNFDKAAKFGIDTQFNWFKDKKISATDLILHELLPLAREGLQIHNVDTGDIDNYLGIIEERAKNHINGARWTMRSYTKLLEQTNKNEALSAVTCAMIENVNKGHNVAQWPLASLSDMHSYDPSELIVSDCMSTDLFTIQKDDIIQLAADLMDWRSISFLPVEDHHGKLVGILTSRLLIRYFAQKPDLTKEVKSVKDIMIADPVTIGPHDSIMLAMQKMRENRIGGLPVTIKGELVGVITDMDFINISARLMERLAGGNLEDSIVKE